MIQVMVFFLMAPRTYFSQRLNGGKHILREMHDLFNPQSTKIISTREITDLDYENEVKTYVGNYSFERVELMPRWLENIAGRDNIHRDSRVWRTSELPGGERFTKRLNRDWLPLEELQNGEYIGNRLKLLKFSRPPDTKEIVFYKKDRPSSNLN